MQVALWLLVKLTPYPNNPRQNDDGVQAVATSLREFGFRQPIVVDGDGVIVCGHTRYKAAQSLGLEKVPVHVAKDLTPEQLRASTNSMPSSMDSYTPSATLLPKVVVP
jgi:ParB-like chromosome segregation protein Spo0J